MRLAVLVSLQPDHATTEAPDAMEVGKLKTVEHLERLGFAIITVSGQSDIERRFIQAVASVSSGDHVLVHITGHLDRTGCIDDQKGGRFSVVTLAAAAAAREPDGLVIMVEATYDDDAEDPLGAATRVDELRRSLDAATSGRTSLIALRDNGGPEDPYEFTRLALRIGEEQSARNSGHVTLSQIADELRLRPESPHVARSYAFSRGIADFDVSPRRENESGRPEWQPLLSLSRFAMEHSKWDWALEGFYAALLVAPDDPGARAQIYEAIGALEQARGRWGAAREAFGKARTEVPSSTAARDGLIAIARTLETWDELLPLERERVNQIEDLSLRASDLFAMARLAVERLHDVPEAIALMEQALAADPTREDIARALARAERVLERKLRDSNDYAEHDDDAGEEAPADVELDESDIIDHAPSLRTPPSRPPRAMKTDPDIVAYVPALSAASSALLPETEPALEDMHLDEAHFEEVAIVHDPFEPEAQTLDELERALTSSPLDSALLGKMFDAACALGLTDRAFLLACVLAELGGATAEQKAFAERNRPDGLRVKSPLTASLWADLRPAGMDSLLDSLFTALGPAAIDVRHQERRARGKVIQLDPQARTSPTSTASAVRCFHWAARILGVTCPDLYVLDDVPGDIAAVPSERPSTALGPGAVRGLSTKTLAFVAGRHLTYYRPEFSVLIHFPTLDELATLVFAAFALGGQTARIPSAQVPAATALGRALERNLAIADRASVAIYAERLGVGVDAGRLSEWARNVELLASRVGLLLSGDMDSVLAHIRRESRPVAGLTMDDRRNDLLTFFASRAHATLRAEILGEPAPSSIVPPLGGDRMAAESSSSTV